MVVLSVVLVRSKVELGGLGVLVFDEVDRPPDDDGRRHAEPHFRYLNRSGRSEAGRVRRLVEAWLERYPSAVQAKLTARLRGSDTELHSAFFELYLHETMRMLGHQPLVESVAGPNGKFPDFFIDVVDGVPFFLEAHVVSGKSHEQAAAEERANQVYDQINKLDSPDFFIGVKVSGFPKSPPPGRQIRHFLREKLSGLSWDELEPVAARDGIDGAPRWRFSHDAWSVEFFPIPKAVAWRGTPESRPLGMFLGEAKALSDVDEIRSAIERKASRYGQLDRAFVIAINVFSGFADRSVVLKALFGTTRITVGRDGAITQGRAPDGLWTSPSGPRYTRVSGVLVCHHVDPWRVATAKAWYCPNPWAAFPLGVPFPGLSRFEVASEELTRIDGMSPGDLFGLAPDWP